MELLLLSLLGRALDHVIPVLPQRGGGERFQLGRVEVLEVDLVRLVDTLSRDAVTEKAKHEQCRRDTEQAIGILTL